MSKLSTFGQHLYEGRVSFDFVGRRKLWYSISVLIVALAATGFVVRGFNMGIEFKGGVEFTAKVQTANSDTVDSMTQAVLNAGVPEAGDPQVTTSGSDALRIQTKALTQDQATKIETELTKAGANEVSQNLIGPTWGKQVASKALTGLLVFIVLVVLFIWAYFREWRMSAAAIVALAHDLIITVGVYAWSGFEITPATVTGLLTILGYSLYDTVVVFDKVRENTRNFLKTSTRTYSESANLAINQTLVRSINTSITALLPVGALLVVGIAVLGTGPLKDLALALFVGMAAGTYSSIFVATPLAAQLKEGEAAVKAQAARVMAKRNKAAAAPAPVTVPRAEPVRQVAASGAAKRNQPTRAPRSQRGKGPK
ncbi:MAG: protein translocase subunit SecF [Actinomycetota bacterium]|nr:protein translocase subunit SecF [Actinomycetota bacterium]